MASTSSKSEAETEEKSENNNLSEELLPPQNLLKEVKVQFSGGGGTAVSCCSATGSACTTPSKKLSKCSTKRNRKRTISETSYFSASLFSNSSSSSSSSSSSYTYEAPDGGWGWVVVIASFFVNMIADGITFSFGLIYNELLQEFGETKAATSIVLGLFHSIPLLAGPIASAVTDKYGCRAVTIFGSILSAIGFLLSSIAQNIAVIYITCGVLAGVGLSLCYVAAVVIVAYYFEEKRSLATGISTCGSGVGTIVFAKFIEYLVQEYNWRGTMIILAGCFLQMIVCAMFFRDLKWVKRKKKRGKTSMPEIDEIKRMLEGGHVLTFLEQKTEEKKRTSSLVNLPFRERKRKRPSRQTVSYRGAMISIPHGSRHHRSCPDISTATENRPNRCRWGNFLTITFSLFLISNFILYGWYDVMYAHLQTYLEKTLFWLESEVSLTLQVIGVFNTLGQLCIGYLGDKPWLPRNALYAICMFLCGGATAVVPFVTQPLIIYSASAVFGLAVSANYALTSPMLVDLVSIEEFSSAYGLLLLLQGISNFAGPPFAGWLYDESGHWYLTFLIGGICIAVSGLLVIIIPLVQKFSKDKKTIVIDPESTIGVL